MCVFAYGQTGSGKTHTMEGSADNPGITPRAFAEIFRVAKESWGAYRYDFKVTIMEIYNETIRDLLEVGHMVNLVRVLTQPSLLLLCMICQPDAPPDAHERNQADDRHLTRLYLAGYPDPRPRLALGSSS